MRLLITVGRMRLAFSLQHLFQLVSNKLNLGSDNDLNAVLTGTDYAGNTCALDLLLIQLPSYLLPCRRRLHGQESSDPER